MRKFLMLIAAFMCSIVMNAQAVAETTTDTIEYPAEYPVKANSVQTNNFWSNWFVGVSGGSQVSIGGAGDSFSDMGLDFGTHVPTVTVNVGKWFTPVFGAKANFNLGHWAAVDAVDYDVNAQLGGSAYADLMLNLSSWVGKYGKQHVYECVPYVGFGRITTQDACQTDSWKTQYWSWNVGLDNQFRVANRLLVDLDLYMRRFNEFGVPGAGWAAYSGRNWNLGAQVGLVCELGNNKWEGAVDGNALFALSAVEIAALNESLRNAEAENARLRELLGRKPTEIIKETVRYQRGECMPVWFAFDSAELTDVAKRDLDCVNTEDEVVVAGYASPEGTEEYNKELSLRRAQAVADYLTARGVKVKEVVGMGETVPEISRVVVIR